MSLLLLAALAWPWQVASPPEHQQASWLRPVQGPITNPFGNSYTYFNVYRGGHTGVDIAAPRGTPVQAPLAGRVVRVRQDKNLRYGSYLIVRHGTRLFSLYAHLQNIKVKPQQLVTAGTRLAEVGVSGAAGYPHLHLEALSALPSRDGAWGYAYICAKKPKQNPDPTLFLNQSAVYIHQIYRGQANCQTRGIPEPVLYYNPEFFWNPTYPMPWHSPQQPANEERKYQPKKPTTPHNLTQKKKRS